MFSYTGAAAVMFCIGTALAFIIECDISVLLLGVMIFIVAPISFCYITKLASGRSVWVAMIAGVSLLAGFLTTQYRTDYSVRPLYPCMDKEVELRGVVSSMPVKYGERLQFVMEVKSADGKSVNERIRVSTETAGIKANDSIVTFGKVKSISGKSNTTSFNSKNYYMRRGIYFSQFAEDVSKSDTLYKMSVRSKITCFMGATVTAYIERFPEEAQPLLKGMILNNKSEIPDETADNMVRSGTYRYIYSPYLHITIILWFLGMCFGRQSKGMPIIICILLLYLAMNTGVTVAWKIALFYGISNAIMYIKHRSNPRAALYLTVLVTGIINPVTLTEPAFIISMTCTVLMRAFSWDLRWRLFDVLQNRRISQTLATYLIITLGIYPMCSFFGYSLTPWSYFTGTILIPVVSLVYIIFYVGFVVFAATGFAYTLGIPYIIKGFMLVCDYVSNLPLSNINLGNCGILFLITFYTFLYAIYRRVLGKKNRCLEVVTAILTGVFVTTALMGINNAEVTFVNVGQGDCAVIKLPFGQAVMVDGGGSPVYSDYDVGSGEVVPFLTANGITKLESVVISHYDKDHTDGLVSVTDIIDVEKIFMPDYEPDNEYREIIEKIAEEKGIEIRLVTEPGEIDLAKNLKGQVVHFEKSDNENDSSIVLKVSYGETDILFTGDISMYTEYMLPKTPVEILKVPHHGSKTSSSTDLIQNTDADYNVICVGVNNPYGHPDEKVLERYNKSSGILLRTDLEGDIHFVIGKNKIKRVWTRSNIIIDKLY